MPFPHEAPGGSFPTLHDPISHFANRQTPGSGQFESSRHATQLALASQRPWPFEQGAPTLAVCVGVCPSHPSSVHSLPSGIASFGSGSAISLPVPSQGKRFVQSPGVWGGCTPIVKGTESQIPATQTAKRQAESG